MRIAISASTIFLSLQLFASSASAGGEGFTFEAEEAKAGVPPGQIMDKGAKRYDRRDYHGAAKLFYSVAVDETDEAADFRPKAEYFLGKCLFNLKLYQPALSWFAKIAEKGDKHPYNRATLKFLAALARKLPPDSGVLEHIGKYTPDKFPAEIADELTYLLGRYHYSQNNFEVAVGLFSSVGSKSKFFANAKFFEGITYVRINRAKPALEAFKEILRVAAETRAEGKLGTARMICEEGEGEGAARIFSRRCRADDELALYEEMANLSMARLFYSTHQFKTALKYWAKIESRSINWLDSLFESSWGFFQLDDHEHALGNIHTINSPYFEREFYPETFIVKAIIEFYNCRYMRARHTVNDFKDTYRPLLGEMRAFLDKYADPVEFYEFFSKFRSGAINISPRMAKIMTIALSDKELKNSIDYVEELKDELEKVKAASKRWKDSPLAGALLEDLTIVHSLAKSEVGAKVKARFSAVIDYVQDLLKQAIRIQIEADNAEAGELEASVREEIAKTATRKRGKVEIDDEHLFWPFRGEYWKDELGYYRSAIVSRCKK